MFQQFVASDNGNEMKNRIMPYVAQVLMVISNMIICLFYVHCFSFLSFFLVEIFFALCLVPEKTGKRKIKRFLRVLSIFQKQIGGNYNVFFKWQFEHF